MESKVHGFTLKARRQSQLNFDLLKANVIDEVTEPLEDPESSRYTIHTRSADTKTLETVEETKRYRVVFDKHVVDPDTFQSYPYGYTRAEFEDVDMENIDMLMEL